MITPKTNIDRFQAEIEVFLEKYHNKPLEKLDLKEMVLELLEIVKTNNLKLPTELAYLGKTTINLEGTVRTIYPEYNLTERLSKFIEKSAVDYLKEKKDEFRSMLHIYYNFPFELQKLYKMVLREKITINILFKEFEAIQKLFEKQVNKVVIAIIFIGLLISSGIFFIAEKEKYGDISLSLAIIFGLYSFYKLLKSKV
jgi:ubiquinone biosynthesis protein